MVVRFWMAARLATGLAAWACSGCLPASAQVQRSGGGEAQKIMQQYQQVAAEKTALQAQLVQMKKDLDAAKGELESTKKERDAASTVYVARTFTAAE